MAGPIRVEKGVVGSMAPEMKRGLGRQKMVFGRRYVGQCSRETKILLFMGSCGGVLTRSWTCIKKEERSALKRWQEKCSALVTRTLFVSGSI